MVGNFSTEKTSVEVLVFTLYLFILILIAANAVRSRSDRLHKHEWLRHDASCFILGRLNLLLLRRLLV